MTDPPIGGSSLPRVWTDAEIAARNQSAPIRDVMRFRLVYHGALPASANRAKPEDVARIRRELSPQLEYLWQTHHALKVLRTQAWRMKPLSRMDTFNAIVSGLTPQMEAQRQPEKWVDLCAPIPVDQKLYTPLVREVLHLNCELNILFLRQDDPGKLITQGGDIDGRIKCLLDALRMPSKAEQALFPPSEDKLWCLMESDSLVSALNVETDRLLFPASEKPNEVHLVIEVSLVVLQVYFYNTCLL